MDRTVDYSSQNCNAPMKRVKKYFRYERRQKQRVEQRREEQNLNYARGFLPVISVFDYDMCLFAVSPIILAWT